jgi:hypothetical protein
MKRTDVNVTRANCRNCPIGLGWPVAAGCGPRGFAVAGRVHAKKAWRGIDRNHDGPAEAAEDERSHPYGAEVTPAQ